MRRTQELYAAYCNGESFTDDEVRLGERHFRALSVALFNSGESFQIPAKEAARIHQGFRSYREARGMAEPAQ